MSSLHRNMTEAQNHEYRPRRRGQVEEASTAFRDAGTDPTQREAALVPRVEDSPLHQLGQPHEMLTKLKAERTNEPKIPEMIVPRC